MGCSSSNVGMPVAGTIDEPREKRTMSQISEASSTSECPIDILVVGAGFSGLSALYNLRQRGFRVRVYEAASDFGGVWYWNCYPGARVDSDNPIYQFSDPELWKDFEWTERFPGYEEIRRYFNHVDKKLGLRKDVQFNTRVASAKFDDVDRVWIVTTEAGDAVRTRYFALCLGLSSSLYFPPLHGLDSFAGPLNHTGRWPQAGVDLRGKKVSIIGTGASGVQVIQEIASQVAHLTVYQRTPNFAFPMRQVKITDPNENSWKFPLKAEYEQIFQRTQETFAGMNFDFVAKNTLDVSPEERQNFYEELFATGGLAFWLANYQDLLFVPEANQLAYEFWRDKTRARINDPVKKEILAPMKPPHAFGTKRPSLEQSYYEVFNRDNVDIIDIKKFPIQEITPTGIQTAAGFVEADIIILATGFDFLTGGVTDIKITNARGELLKRKWQNGVSTYLGIGTNGYPNLFFLAGPQATAAFTNGPTIAKLHAQWFTEMMTEMRSSCKTLIEVKKEAEEGWTELLSTIWNASLFPDTDSWYQGANIPGKTRQPLNYAGGFPNYIKIMSECAKNGYDGFTYD